MQHVARSVIKIISVICCLSILGACKVRIEVPDGGSVVTESGDFECRAMQTCDVDVVDIFFDKTFIATPKDGLYFDGWEKRDRGLFGDSYDPARIATSGFVDYAVLMSFLESDEVFYLTPTFSDECSHECNVVSIKLFKQGFSFFGDPEEIAWPFQSNSTVSASVSGIPQPTTYSIAKYFLEASGSDFTISNVRAYDQTSAVNPYFSGLSEGMIIRDGNSIEFELISPLTGGLTAQLIFSFKILETGDSFTSNISFRSN